MALRDQQESVSEAAARALQKIGEHAVPFFIDALKEKNEALRAIAAGVLGQIAQLNPFERNRVAARYGM